MKYPLTIFLFCCLILFPYPLMGDQQIPPLSHAPSLFVEQTDIDVGTLVEGKSIRHTFLLKNKGNAPLIIDRVKTDCACTKVAHDPVIQPGRNSYLRVMMNTSGQTGPWTRSIRILSNDPRSPETILTITANVLEAVRVTPNRVFFNGVTGHPLDQVVTITGPGSKPFTLTLKQRQLSDQTGVYIESLKDHYFVHIRHKAETPETSRGRILLSTDIPQRTLISIPVFSRIQASDQCQVFPNEIRFGKIKKKTLRKTITRALNLRHPTRLPEIESLHIDNKRFSTQIMALERLNTLRIEISANLEQFDMGLYRSELELTLKGLEKKKFVIPLQLEIQ